MFSSWIPDDVATNFTMLLYDLICDESKKLIQNEAKKRQPQAAPRLVMLIGQILFEGIEIWAIICQFHIMWNKKKKRQERLSPWKLLICHVLNQFVHILETNRSMNLKFVIYSLGLIDKNGL